MVVALFAVLCPGVAAEHSAKMEERIAVGQSTDPAHILQLKKAWSGQTTRQGNFAWTWHTSQSNREVYAGLGAGAGEFRSGPGIVVDRKVASGLSH